MNVLSLFDGMACGMLAFQKAGVEVDSYTAYEIDKYAIQTATHNFPMIKECGDVFKADFTQYKDIDYIIGGSPCVPAGSKVKTNKGYKSIENIVIGDKVLTHKNRYRQVVRLYKRKSDHIYTIKFDNDIIIKITGNHPIYTYRNNKFEFVRTDELKVGDYGCINIDNQNQYDNRLFIVEDKILIKIKEIEKDDIDITVYNIEAEEDHSYTVEDIIVKNCTYWSIAQNKNNRETEASGLGWDLFSQYVRAIKEVKPKYFIYENNKSMSSAIRQSITETFGFEPICINSALVSAQNRQRLYWIGKRNDDGTYSKVEVEQPEDLGILIKDILDGNAVLNNTKSRTLHAGYGRLEVSAWYKRVYSTNKNKQQHDYVAEPVCVAERGRYNEDGKVEQHFEAREDGKTNVLTTVQKDNNIAEPVCMRYERSEEAKRVRKQYESGELQHGFHELHELHPRTDGKTNTLSTALKDNPICEPLLNTYAIPVEFEDDIPIKAKSCADDKIYPVYEVKDGIITIKDKRYSIKLADGFYIIRKLTVSECKRLQTVPEWYEFPVSDSQAYKMLGNGWTINVIAHLIKATLK